MTREETAALFARRQDAMNRHDVGGLTALFADDCVVESPTGGGVVQGGVITQIADAAMGKSLGTMQEDHVWNTTIELKINFIRPVVSGRIRAIGRVVEIKQTLMFSEADVLDDQDRLVARASSTCLPVPEGQGRE